MAKRKPGKRDKGGRLLRPPTREARATAHDHGNEWVRRRAALFAIFQTNKPLKPEEHCDGPGQAHIAGLFDNLPADAIAIRDAAREFGDLYWYYFADLQAKSANIAGSIGGRGSLDPSARDRRFARLDEALGAMASPVRRAVYALCIDYWGSDEVAPYLQRLINERRVLRKQPVAGLLPTEADRDRWELTCAGLLLMVAGANEREKRSAA